MKKIYVLSLIALMSLSLATSASDTLFYRFNNYYIVEGTPFDTLIFETEIRSSTPGTYLSSFQIDMLYNVNVFGDSIVPVQVTDLDMVGPGLFVGVGPNVSAANHFRYGRAPLFPPYDPLFFAQVPVNSWGKLVRFKMLVIDNSQAAGIQFKISSMANVQRFVTQPAQTMLYYGPVIASNSLLTLPSTPTNLDLMLSELGDPSDSNADFVEIYNAGSEAIDFSLYPWFLTAFDGNSYQHIQMSGSLNAGQTYVVAGPSFAAAYPGKSADQAAGFIEGNGTISYFLSLFGPYNDGIFTDKYDGSALSYTGKHAVRPFLVISPSTSFTASEWNVLPATTMEMTPGSHRTTIDWDGSFNNVWSDTANWTPSFVPDAGHNANVPDNLGPLPVITSGTNAKVHNLNIDGSSN